jgi:hypothetical protein
MAQPGHVVDHDGGGVGEAGGGNSSIVVEEVGTIAVGEVGDIAIGEASNAAVGEAGGVDGDGGRSQARRGVTLQSLS